MMRLVIATIGALGLATMAAAQAPEQGLYSDQLRAIFVAVAGGTCPEKLMGAGLLGACREQLPRMAPALRAGGAIQSMTFLKAEDANGQRYESYKVAFANGKPTTWAIGALKDGKFDAVYSLGD